MRILGIETSCDETAAAVVENGTKVLSSVVASSVELQAKYGGIVPEQAAREQVRAIMPVVSEALSQVQSSKCKVQNCLEEIDAIAVTVGPGLIGSLLVGVETAKTLAFVTGKPIVPVNHLVGHVYGAWLQKTQNSKLKTQNYNSKFKTDVKQTTKLPQFPALVLVASGGHTELVVMGGHGDFKWIGGTRDDAAGECFDKCARILGLPYPGGPSVAAAAANYQLPITNYQIRLPRPLIDSKDFDFSFSGLKTAVLNEVAKAGLNEETQKYFAYEIQEAITDVLVKKTVGAALGLEVLSVLVVGGVAANKVLREKMQRESERNNLRLCIPEFKFCTDNAAYIASAAYFNYHPAPWQEVDADSGLTIG